MKTVLTNLADCGLAPFTFAGQQFPKHVWDMPRGKLAKRLADRKAGYACGGYYHAPTPRTGGNVKGIGFYLDSDGAPGLRWTWADEVDGASIRHTGWFTDEDGCGEKIRGIVMRLPHGRGFLAGWSMGEGMASTVDFDVYSDEVSAARAADSIAESAAETEREYQDKERAREEREEEERQRLADETADYYTV